MKTVWQRLNRWLRIVLSGPRWVFEKLKAVFVWFVGRIRTVWRFVRKPVMAVGTLLYGVLFPVVWPLKQIWRFVGIPLGRYVLWPIWRYLGKLGLALRKMIGKLALALRKLLGWLIWPFAALLTVLGLGFKQAGLIIVERVKAWWQAGAPARIRLYRRWHSWWLIRKAKWRILFKRPSPPKQAIIAPRIVHEKPPANPRPRFITAFVTVNVLVLAFSLVFTQITPTAADLDATLIARSGDATRTPSPTPSNTPTATYTPSPTPTATPATIALTPWPTPDPLSSGGSVAFTMRQNGNSDLYVLSLGQDEPVRVTNHRGVDRDPAWRPDGRQLAFTSDRSGNWEIYILDLPTGDIEQVTNDMGFDGGAKWSPDGQWLVYEGYRNNNFDIYIIKADGSEGPIRLTEHAAPDFSPVWSPDGRNIAFTSWRSGNKDIFMMSLNQVGDDRAINLTASTDVLEDNAVFHPTGDALAYYAEDNGFNLVYVQPLVEYRPQGEAVSLGQGKQPAWSPNGQSLAYIHTIGAQNYLLASSIDAWSVAPQTFATTGQLEDPAWSAITLVQEPTGFLLDIAQTEDTPLYTEPVSQTVDSEVPYLLLELDVEAPYPFMSDRVEQSFLQLRGRLIGETGWDYLGTLDKMYEPLDERPGPGQTAQTWYKAGRAFDTTYEDVLAFNPRVEIGREDKGNETYWRIYLQTALQDGSQGEPLRDRPWDFRARFGSDPRYYDQGGAWRDQIPAGYYVDFTGLAADYGWERVPALNNWRTYFPGIRFWQYQKPETLNWEEAMLEIYGVQEILDGFGQP